MSRIRLAAAAAVVLLGSSLFAAAGESTAAADAASSSAGTASAPSEEGLRLLRLSLQPGERPYEGVLEVFSGQGPVRRARVAFAPPSRHRRDVYDASGELLFSSVSDGIRQWVYDARRFAYWEGAWTDSDEKLMDPDEEYRLLLRNYEFRAGGRRTEAGVPCSVLEVLSRKDGSLARRLCVEEGGLVLMREAPGAAGGSWARFESVRLGVAAPPERFRFSLPPRARRLSRRWRPDYLEVDEACSAAGLPARAPSWLPPGYVLESVDVLPAGSRSLLHYRYTDGLEVLSFFQGPPRARVRFLGSSGRGVQNVSFSGLRGRAASRPEGHVLDWSSGGRFVLIGPLPLATLKRVAESVPR